MKFRFRKILLFGVLALLAVGPVASDPGKPQNESFEYHWQLRNFLIVKIRHW